ncbi:hypothetical protein ACFTZB_37665, partial [Rhodococcus sp. NPDC057014]
MTTRTRITGVRVFDGEDSLPLPMDVTFDAGGIVSVTPAGSAGASAAATVVDGGGATVVDGGGATVLPGLIDAHIHLHDADT